MSEFVLFTDSGCDIKPEILKEWDIPYQNLTFRFEGDATEYTGDDMDIHSFYNSMREGGIAKTAAINPDTFLNAFEKILALFCKAGNIAGFGENDKIHTAVAGI